MKFNMTFMFLVLVLLICLSACTNRDSKNDKAGKNENIYNPDFEPHSQVGQIMQKAHNVSGEVEKNSQETDRQFKEMNED